MPTSWCSACFNDRRSMALGFLTSLFRTLYSTPMRKPEDDARGAQNTLSLTELAKELAVAHYRLSEWVRLGLLSAPIVLRVRKNGRATAYGFPVASLPEIRKRVALLKKGGLPWPKSSF